MAGSGSRNGPSLGRILRVIVIVLIVLILLPYVIVPFYRFINPVSTLMLWRWATGARVEHTWVPLARIAPTLPLAVVSSEDGGFCRHHGVDFSELRDVLRDIDDIKDLADVRGGSTLTQQAAKNLFLWQGRSYVRKVLEFPLAFWIDAVLGKRRLMEIYLNIVEWGPNGEFGAEAAARRAFNKSAHDLNTREAALLAATLPNPRRRDARAPTAELRRLAGIYQGRMAKFPNHDACVATRRGP